MKCDVLHFKNIFHVFVTTNVSNALKKKEKKKHGDFYIHTNFMFSETGLLTCQ